jgi:hypothetical protein
MGDWVAHLSNTAARRILVTYPLLAAVSGEGSPEPPSIRKNKPMESMLQLFLHAWAFFAFPFSSRRRYFFKGYVSTLSISFSCVHLKYVEEARIWMEHISSLFFLPPCFPPPLAEGSCKPKVQVQDALWSHCKTETLIAHARNQVSKPSAEMELVR